MFDILKSFLPRAVQDLITAGVSCLAVHGYVTADQTQSLIGSLFFIVMLIANYFIAQARKENAAAAGANTVGGALTPSQATAIAKTGKPQ